MIGHLSAPPPDRFRHVVELPSGRSASIDRQAQHLFTGAERLRRTGLPLPTPDERLEIARAVAEALVLLHGPDVDVVLGRLDAVSSTRGSVHALRRA